MSGQTNRVHQVFLHTLQSLPQKENAGCESLSAVPVDDARGSLQNVITADTLGFHFLAVEASSHPWGNGEKDLREC